MKEKLYAIGFDQKEANIYIALLKKEHTTVNELLKHTSIERRTIYDVLERLIQKGQASYFEENNTRVYKAVDPEIIFEDLQIKAQEFKNTIPQLKNLIESPQEVKVEILKGVKGLRTIFLDVMNSKKTHYAFGDISPLIYIDEYSKVVKKFLKEMSENEMQEKIIYSKGDAITKVKGSDYRAIDKNLITPTPTLIYGDVVTQYIYTEPMTIIKITSKEVAKTHMSYFNHFWKLGEKINNKINKNTKVNK